MPVSTCPAGCRCSGTPGCPSPRSGSSPRSAGSATSTCGCRRPRRPCGTTWRPPWPPVPYAAATTRPPRSSVTPLLASLGRDARELQRGLAGAVDHDAALPGSPAPAPTTLLGHLQADLRANHAPTAAERAGRVVDPDDRSVQVHACHGSHRQIDVLREVLVGILQDRPDLEPRDILVMCPTSRPTRR